MSKKCKNLKFKIKNVKKEVKRKCHFFIITHMIPTGLTDYNFFNLEDASRGHWRLKDSQKVVTKLP